jgi:beta-N-acetylhexosaminidase
MMTMAAEETSDDIGRLIDSMSLEEKVSQMFVIAAWGTAMSYDFDAYLRAYKPGGVIFLGNNIGYADQLRSYVSAIHGTNEAIPPLVAVDQEGGPVSRVYGDPAPGAVALGQESDKSVRTYARERAEFLMSYGFDVNFAPVADVAYKPTSFMAQRSFGTTADLVARKVEDFVVGSRDGGMAGAAKHFPGHGRTMVDSHVALPEVLLSIKGWKKTDALPFKAAVSGGVEMIMVGHLYYPKWEDAPTSLSRVAISTLRSELDFDKVVVTDDLGMGALGSIDPYQVLDRAVKAGVDILLYASSYIPITDLMAHLVQRVQQGKVTEKRIDLSLRRILAVKAQRFALAYPKSSEVVER